MIKTSRVNVALIRLLSLLSTLMLLSSCGEAPIVNKNAVKTPLTPPSKLVVFGDSLSDQGNMFILAREITHFHHLHMSSPPTSHQGMAFTNGQLPVEFVAKALGDDLQPAWRPSTVLESEPRLEMNPEILDLLAPTAISTAKPDVIKAAVLTPASTLEFAAKAEQKIPEKFSNPNPSGLNYAVAGAAIANDYSGLRLNIYNKVALDKQVNAYAKRADKSLIDQTLFIFFIGGNDLLNVFADKHFVAEDKKRKKISSLPAVVVDNIKRVQALGAKRILVIGPPDISTTPALFNTSSAALAQSLSQQLEREMEVSLSKAFPGQDVLWLPMQSLFAQWLQAWTPATRNRACVTDIEAGYYELGPLLAHEELVVKFINGCSQSLLDQQQYPFFDSVHPSEKIYQLFAEKMLEKIKQFKAD